MHPDAVIKHDGRKVAFDAARLETSVARAACDAREALTADAAARLGRQICASVCENALADGKNVIASADIRALAVQSLRRLKFDGVADSYQECARAASLLLWRVRVVEPEMPRVESSGTPWDRRRLLESLRATGVAFDTAGAAARDVERGVVTLGREFVSPAMIHALAMLELPPGAFGARAYGVRRVAYSASENLPHWSERPSGENQLPSGGAALEQFWLQGVHSPDVVKAVRDNLLSLDPYPSTTETDASEMAAPVDPLAPDFGAALKSGFASGAGGLNVRADSVERIGAIAAFLACTPIETGILPPPGAELSFFFKTPEKNTGSPRRAAPVTVNAGGLVAREALRDPRRAAVRLSDLARLAARAHREREEYFILSPVRGRVLPIAVAGLWNATAWIQGGGFDTTRAPIGARQTIAPLCQAMRGAIEATRNESGMDLVLTGAAPLSAERRLWRNDRGFFLRDGMNLNAASAYDSGPELTLSSAMDDFTNRLDFAKALGEAFDEPPALTIEAPLAPETSAADWSELLGGLAQAGVARARLVFGGSARAVPNLTRAVRSYLIGFPLLDGLEEARAEP